MDNPVVTVKDGKLRGETNDGISCFLNVPYCQPPVGHKNQRHHLQQRRPFNTSYPKSPDDDDDGDDDGDDDDDHDAAMTTTFVRKFFKK